MRSARTKAPTTLFALYFLFFLTLLAPLHALDHAPHILSLQDHLAESGNQSGHWLHNQDLCQLCKSSGQPAFCPFLVPIGTPHVPCGSTRPAVVLNIESADADATTGRSPPSA